MSAYPSALIISLVLPDSDISTIWRSKLETIIGNIVLTRAGGPNDSEHEISGRLIMESSVFGFPLIKYFFPCRMQENTDSVSWLGALMVKELCGARLKSKSSSPTEPLWQIPASWKWKKDEGTQENPLSVMRAHEIQICLISRGSGTFINCIVSKFIKIASPTGSSYSCVTSGHRSASSILHSEVQDPASCGKSQSLCHNPTIPS
jgi:hypothetical protein